MKSIDQMISDILKAEGGYVDDPKDKGGATNMGVSLRYAKGIGLDNDGDGDTDKDDIRLVTVEQARNLYRKDFYTAPRIHALPAVIQPMMFDMAVLHGPPRAIILLQRVLGGEDDGVIGKQTRMLAEDYAEKNGDRALNNRLVDMRLQYIAAIVKRDPSQQRFLKGWTNRAESFRIK